MLSLNLTIYNQTVSKACSCHFGLCTATEDIKRKIKHSHEIYCVQ